ncbi:uncharacterized protein F5Z01DRAFT_194190 [Emericellopsis atlantica]|uniref:Uncharacterized protein n=1 Tax=Emericellopsis atlantica TaxID=2614577 RepID=A0A9P8CTL0_9HYPO|nr:uncharacterized protein F5Z01DRAFT_194190 [Emericellopsis atlantica]KAG9258360.1 hypothetical protein F5Z01DRAFT_194190 [Emericellopsis atlantica]
MNPAPAPRALICRGLGALRNSTRCYATVKNMSPQARAAARAAQAYKAQKSQPDEEYDDIAARAPLKKPSTSGLGIPSAVPSSSKKPNLSPRSSRDRPDAATTDAQATMGEAAALAERREAQLRYVRLQRIKAEEQARGLATGEKTYDQRYKELSRRWLGGMVGLPLLLVTSYYLFDRLFLGGEAKPIPKYGDDD